MLECCRNHGQSSNRRRPKLDYDEFRIMLPRKFASTGLKPRRLSENLKDPGRKIGFEPGQQLILDCRFSSGCDDGESKVTLL